MPFQPSPYVQPHHDHALDPRHDPNAQSTPPSQVPKAFVVLKEGSGLDAGAIQAALGEKIAAYKVRPCRALVFSLFTSLGGPSGAWNECE